VQNFFASLIAILKCEDQDTQKCKFACCFVWVWNLVSHIEGGTRSCGCSGIGCWGRYFGLRERR
jgi:hypothetical protein